MSPKREILRLLQNIKLFIRYTARKNSAVKFTSQKEISLSEIDVLYINLEHRTDRRKHIINEFRKVGINHAKRVPAIPNKIGALGCTQSHLKIYQRLIKEKCNKLVMICEDDIEFLISKSRLTKIINCFADNDSLDVICLAYNRQNGIKITNDLIISSKIKTTACYLVKPQVIPCLLQTALFSYENLKAGKPIRKYAIDVAWHKAQEKFLFGIPQPRAVRQIPSYSDITNTYVDYGL